uniref:Uncharacterized protein n=1 Tax=Rhizophora mucronata TaxID=61149 RepID=A0A2P2ND27_RHIMU
MQALTHTFFLECNLHLSPQSGMQSAFVLTGGGVGVGGFNGGAGVGGL